MKKHLFGLYVNSTSFKEVKTDRLVMLPSRKYANIILYSLSN